MWKRILLVLVITLPLAAQEVDDYQRQIDDLCSQLEEIREILDSLIHDNNPIDLGARITEAFESGSNLASFTLWFVSIIGGLLIFVLGFFGFKEIRKAEKIKDEAQTAKQKAEEFAEKTEKRATKAEGILQKLEERTKRLDEVEPRIKSVEYKVIPAFFFGMIARDEEKYEKALEHFEQAIKEDPQNDEAWFQKGYCLSKLNRNEEAIRAYVEAIRLKPDFPEAHNNKGIALGKLERYDEAIEASDGAIRLKPNSPNAYNNKAFSFLKWGANLKGEEKKEKFELAKENAKKAIEYSNGKKGHYNLACAQARLGELDEALESLTKDKDNEEVITVDPWQDKDLAALRKGEWRKKFIEIIGPPPEGVEES